MTGAKPPSETSLQQRLARRMLSLEKRGVLKPRRKETRQTIEPAEAPTNANSLGLSIM